MTRRWITALSLALGLGLAILGKGAAAEEATGASVLAEPRTHAIMRHALAPGYSDPAAFDVDDCATQRNLDDRGRAQARATGEALRAAGARFDRVWTSEWCRCRDTAGLMDLGEPVEVPALNSFFEDRSTREAQTEALREKLAALPPGETAMLVTHQVNISALLGEATRSGEVIFFTIGEDGETEIRGGFTIPPR